MMSGWSDEDEERLRAEVEKGIVFSKIAPMIGKTRNACIGKAHRLGLEIFTTRGSNTKRKTKIKPPPKPKPKPKPTPILLVPAPVGGGISILKLKDASCRWIFDDKTFCGRIQSVGSYCKDHAPIVYRPPEERPRHAHSRQHFHRPR